MNKGDIVRVKAKIFTLKCDPKEYVNYKLLHMPPTKNTPKTFWQIRSLFREDFGNQTFLGILLGKTYVATGIYLPAYDRQGSLKEDKRHLCWKVEPLTSMDRYFEAIHCLEDDLELFQELSFKIGLYAETKSDKEDDALVHLNSKHPLMRLMP